MSKTYAIFHEQSDYYCKQQMSTQNIIFLEKKLVVSNILSFASSKMLVKLSFCFLHAELFLLKNLFVLCYKTTIQALKNYNSVPLR